MRCFSIAARRQRQKYSYTNDHFSVNSCSHTFMLKDLPKHFLFTLSEVFWQSKLSWAAHPFFSRVNCFLQCLFSVSLWYVESTAIKSVMYSGPQVCHSSDTVPACHSSGLSSLVFEWQRINVLNKDSNSQKVSFWHEIQPVLVTKQVNKTMTNDSSQMIVTKFMLSMVPHDPLSFNYLRCTNLVQFRH